jgi:hypothetical protein
MEETTASIAYLTAEFAQNHEVGEYVVVVRTRGEFSAWLREPKPGVTCIQVEGLIGDPEVWAMAAQGTGEIPLDVVLSDPAAEFAALYRLVDVRILHPVRVTIPCRPGFLKALRLAAALQLSVRLLPGQPDALALAELAEAAEFYLRDPMVEAPVEFFHSVLAAFLGRGDGTLWMFLEQDPGLYSQCDPTGRALYPADFVVTHLERLLEEEAECATCRWQPLCAGYFKWPDPRYDCTGVKQLFALLESAADEITRDLAVPAPAGSIPPPP